MDPSLIYDVNDNIVIDTCFQKNCNRLKHGFDFEKLDENIKKYILNRLRHKIEHFFRGMPADVKMDYIQDAKYCLLSEKYAYSTQRKYAKIAKKKHFPFNADELENENKNFMFDEKIKLLKDMGFEIIKKERSEHARRLKEHKKLTNVKTK